MEETTQKPEGKGLAVTGFIISLVAIVFLIFVWIAALATAALGGNGYILSVSWLVVALAGTILSFMGMKKLGATGGKKGLAMTGLILGIIAVISCAWLIYGVSQAQNAVHDLGGQFNDALKQLNDSLK